MSEREIDRQILEACQQGDREAFRRLFEAYRDTVYTIALHFLHGDEASAEDITQEVFVRLFTRIRQYRREAEFSTWLYRIVANACLDEQRRRKPFVHTDAADAEESLQSGASPSPEELYDRLELTHSVRSALAGLTPSLRLTLLLKYFEELSYDEIARVLGCSKGTVASRLHRGLKILAGRLAHLRPLPFSGE
jgi:RNA polymerase sigma-70 factor (ECF subfamily)